MTFEVLQIDYDCLQIFNNVILKLRGADDGHSKKGKPALKDLKNVLTADQYKNLVTLEK